MAQKDLNQPATKGDLAAVKSELKNDITRLEEIAKTNTLDISRIKEDVGGIRETMAAKDDINRVMNSIDRFAAEYISYRNRDILRGDEIMKHGDRLNDHEARLQKLETK
ncbi:MAG: hypothetical protein KKH28_06755 [Elusimicrobia bacterium]|nr:hypothetical protein [Elusimicrobiota bacterium]